MTNRLIALGWLDKGLVPLVEMCRRDTGLRLYSAPGLARQYDGDLSVPYAYMYIKLRGGVLTDAQMDILVGDCGDTLAKIIASDAKDSFLFVLQPLHDKALMRMVTAAFIGLGCVIEIDASRWYDSFMKTH